MPEFIDIAKLPSLRFIDRRQLPNIAACYLVLEGNNVIYMGQSGSLVVRWLNHNKIKQSKDRGSELKIAWLECSAPGLLKTIEDALIDDFQPELNHTNLLNES